MDERSVEGGGLELCAQKLSHAAEALEQVLNKLEAQYRALDAKVERIVASIDESEESEPRLEQMQAAGRKDEAQRKTVSPMMAALLSKQGVELKHPMEAEALQEALKPLSVEQRIAVKMELARSGAIG